MKNFKHLLLLMFLGSIVLTGFAQVVSEDPNDYRERDQQSLQDFQEGNVAFPPKPRNQLSIGVKGGLSTVAGDVSPQADGGFALNVRKALGHAFSVRLHLGLGRATGMNYQSAKGYAGHANPWDVNYRKPLGGPENAPSIFYNFQMRYGDVGVEGVVNLNNINFYKETNKWNMYAALGIGVMGYNVKVDALNASGQVYEFSSVETIAINQGDALGIEGRRDRIAQLKTILDGEYESFAEGHGDEQGLTVSGDPYVINPYISGALGLRYRVAPRIELELEHRFVRTNDDLMDGQRWQEHGGPGESVLTRDMDMYNLTSLGIHFRLGKGVESLWWQNPVSGIYSDIADTKKLVNSLTEDTDGDGVPDLYDKEPDTPEDSPVDPSGRALDSDRDGIPDTEDAEPFSSPNVDVDGQGRAMDSDNDGVPDAYDKEPNSPAGMYYDAKGVAIVFPASEPGGVDQACLLPIIYFDLDRDNIKPDFYPELYYIAQVMRSNPDLKVSSVGHTDNRNTDSYNQDLSMRRVNNAVDFLVNTYGIDRDRFVTAYKGEEVPQIGDLPDNGSSRKLEPLHYVNRRVEFECIK